MASRRLKFKPKPLVNSLVRRTREKEDLSESTTTLSGPTSQEDERSLKPADVSSKSSTCQETKSEHTTKEFAAAALLLNLSSSSGNSFKSINLKNNTTICNEVAADKANITFESTSDSDPKHNSVDSRETISKDVKSRASVLVQHTNALDIIQTSVDCKTKKISDTFLDETLVPIIDSTNNSNPNHSSVESKVDPTSDKSLNTASEVLEGKSSQTSDKSNTLKIAPKFGRSRCKPVLSNLAKRKKLSTEENDCVNTNITSVRTESVIKSVEVEISKVNSTILEIKESFTEIEEEEEVKHVKADIEINTEINKISASTKDIQPVNTELRTKTVIVDKPIVNPKSVLKDTPENGCEYKDKPTVPSRVPVSPVRSTAKLVPKPSPRLSDVNARRLSFQGSDSEEERKHKKPYLTSESELIKSTSDKKLKNNKRKQRAQGSTYSKMGQETLENFSKKFGKSSTPDRSQLKMIDLIFYNPKSNPMTIKTQNKPLVKKQEEKHNENSEENVLAEQEVDDVEEAPAVPVPQLTIGPDGQIMLDPKSLVIETTGTEKSRAELEKSEVVQETGPTRYTMYSKKRRPRFDWTPQETLQFYKALNTIGTDFSLMCQLFPKRSRHDLKLKFKKEEKTNLQLIDKAIKGPIEFNFESLAEDLKAEREEIAQRKLEKELEEEAVKREKALKKEEKLKERENKKQKPKIDRTKRSRYAAIKDFDETEVKHSHLIQGTHKPPPKKRKTTRKKTVKVETDSSDNPELESESEDEGLKMIRMVKQVSSGRIIKPSTKLEEYEEMNETLRKSLKRNSDDEFDEDSYSFLPGAQMLFGEPEIEANPTQDPDENITFQIPTVPSIEQLVPKSNFEEVSEISELGSFGQNDSVLDLSVPVRANITRDMLLNRHIISESIQIIDQLTENQETSEVVLGNENAMEDIHEILPSFETVDRNRPPVIYSLQTSCHPKPQSAQDVHDDDDSSVVGTTLHNNSEECILGD